MSTAIFVVYAAKTLELAWLPDEANVVIVHNDDRFDRASIDRDVLHIDAPGNVGFGAAVNLALPQASGDRVVLCNPDLVVTAEHWRALAAGLGPDDLVTVPLVDERGEPTSVCNRYPTAASHLASGCRVGRWLPRGSRARALAGRALGSWGHAHSESLRSSVGAWPLSDFWLSGAALSVDRERLLAIGGFDEEYFLYYEDVDLCERLAATHPGMRAVVADVAPGIHTVGGTAVGRTGEVERIRLESAIRYAQARRGRSWRVCAELLRARRRFLR